MESFEEDWERSLWSTYGLGLVDAVWGLPDGTATRFDPGQRSLAVRSTCYALRSTPEEQLRLLEELRSTPSPSRVSVLFAKAEEWSEHLSTIFTTQPH